MASRDEELSRRTVVALTPAAFLVPSRVAEAAAERDEAREACLRYVAMEDKVQDLLEEWANLENQLATRHADFFKLSHDDLRRLPGGGRLLEIEQELDMLDVERDKLLPKLPKLKCRTVGAVIAKLMVAERLVHPEDHPEAHKMIGDSVKDLGRLLST